jgi:predicted O-linked N-acetylglucosamine transferase (SPINDLY family)
MSARCAPLQLSWVNHAGTTGVPNVDYYIGDAVSLPEGVDPYYSEKLLRLPGCVFCFTYDPKTLPAVAPSPHVRSGRITFGYFGNASKLNSRLAELWARVLDATPGSRLFLRFAALSHPANRRYAARMFARYGVTGDRLVLQPGTDREGILHSYAEVDISLDSSPFCGGSSIAESLWQGVPVVTLRGERFASAYGSSILLASGLGDLVASTPDEYVEIASQLAGNTDRLVHLRSNLRTMVTEHGFSDARLFASRIEAAYEAALADQLRRKPWETASHPVPDADRSPTVIPVRLPARVPAHAFADADPSAEPRHEATSLSL